MGEGVGVGVDLGVAWDGRTTARPERKPPHLSFQSPEVFTAVAFLPPHAPLVCMRHAPCRSMRLEEEIGDFYHCGLQLAGGQCFSACSLKLEGVESGIVKWYRSLAASESRSYTPTRYDPVLAWLMIPG